MRIQAPEIRALTNTIIKLTIDDMASSHSSSSGSLPSEILDNIVVFAADSGGPTIALSLSLISHSFYESVIKRIYHTIIIQRIDKLEEILWHSAVQKPWVAACVRVLIINVAQKVPQSLVATGLVTFPGLVSLCLPASTLIDATCSLPCLRRLVQLENGSLPIHIAGHITHLYLWGAPSRLVSQLVEQKDTLQSLTHLLVVNGFLEGICSDLDILQPIVPHGLPKSLKVFVIFTDITYDGLIKHKDLLEKAQYILDTDPRIVFWRPSGNRAPESWTGPHLFEYRVFGSLIDQCLGAMPDGTAGIWEVVDYCLANYDKTTGYPRH
ncbi:hypothetical protein DL96DRAFT_1613249 [Flagelloscypha sp. PMI_526]|nr:hypothetical protein DL96DRAFT_1613249 [Flagelloscypha sp. PMI_526]